MAGMGKLERLLDLLTVLMETDRPLTRHEIRSTIPAGAYADDDVAFLRTFDRDKNDLRSLGIPLIIEQVPGGEAGTEGYRVDREAVGADLPVLDAEESTSLALAVAVVRIDPDRPSNTIWKFGDPAEEARLEEVGLPTTEVPGNDAVRSLMLAVTERRVVIFSYRGEERTLEPHRLVFAKGHWQLTGHDRLRDAVRQYRVDRIEVGVSVGDETFPAPEVTRDVEVDHAWRFGDGPATAVHALVDGRHVPWLVAFLGAEAEVVLLDDGSAEVVEQVRDLDAYRGFLLTFLDGAEVLEPPEARDHMVRWLQAMAGDKDLGDCS